MSTAKRQRLIDVTKALLDIAKESADAFPPLKSCLGGINALIKHYEACFHRIISLRSANGFSKAIPGRERQAGGPDTLGDQVEGHSDEGRRERRSRGSGETSTASKVRIASLVCCHDKLISCRSLDDIEKRAQALSEKGTMARVLDKARDASAVVKLVDQLQKTIIIYQVCARPRLSSSSGADTNDGRCLNNNRSTIKSCN